MKRLFLLVLAIGLLALGALGEHVLNPGGRTPAAAGTSTPASSPAPAGTAAFSSTTAALSASAIDAATEHAYAVAAPSIVYVVNPGVGTGSGVVYDSKGDIVTNYHVVNGASKLSITLNDGRVFSATIVGTDAADDLAVIHTSASNLTPAQFAAAGGYKVAQSVLAVGSPLGLKQSVAFGLISGIHRVEQEPNGAYLPDALQTSAPINPGNSGGALISLDGTVVGIPTLQQTSSQDGSTAQDIGFAIPSDRVTFVANQIIASGKVQHTGRAYLGIAPTDAASNQSGSQFGSPFGGFNPNGSTPTTSGALVQQLSSNGPAAKAGVHQGDVITAADGTPVTDASDLLTVLAQKKPGDSISLKINRNGSDLTVQVHLGELPA
jgi:S1-C subfamily serine protease